MKKAFEVLLPFSLAVTMTACGNMDSAEQDGSRQETDSASSSLTNVSPAESTDGSYAVTCTNWSDWSNSGYSECYITAGACRRCVYDYGVVFTPGETEKCPGYFEPTEGTRNREYRIRQCFDEYGRPLPLERETRWVLVRCGC